MPSSPNYYAPPQVGRPAAFGYIPPWSSNEERLTSEALAVADLPGDYIADIVRGPAPELFPPRTGYGDRKDRIPTITDVLSVDRNIQDRAIDFSGGPGDYSATSRPSLGWAW